MTREDRQIIIKLVDECSLLSNNLQQNIDFAVKVIHNFPFSYFSILRGKRFTRFWNNVIDYTKFLDTIYSKSDITRLYYFINKITNTICCNTCGKPIAKKITPLFTYPAIFHCSTFCAQRDVIVKNKITSTKDKNQTTTKDLVHRQKQRTFEKYGVESIFQLESTRQKIKKTFLAKYGVEHPMQSEDVKKKFAKTVLAKYGIESLFKDENFQKSLKKKYQFEGMQFDSAAEIAYYIWLRDNNIKFEYQPEISFKYSYLGKEHFYIPDFKVNNAFIEIKGDQFFKEDGTMQNPFCHEQDGLYEAKHQCMLDNNVVILRTKDYIEYYDYVSKKYGKHYLQSLCSSTSTKRLFLVIPWLKDLAESDLAFYKRQMPTTLPKAMSHNYIIKHFQQDTFYATEKQLWLDSSIREKLIANRCKYLGKAEDKLDVLDLLDGFKKSGIYYGYSQFNPLWFKWFILKFGCKVCYDPCGGWGHRVLGGLILEKYIYNDLSQKTKLNVDCMLKKLGIRNTVTSCNDARSYVPVDDFDSMFTCPPYFNLEKYECSEFKDKTDFDRFIDSLFNVFQQKKSCKVFGLVIREDLLVGHTGYIEKHVLTVQRKKHLNSTSNKHNECLFVYKK